MRRPIGVLGGSLMFQCLLTGAIYGFVSLAAVSVSLAFVQSSPHNRATDDTLCEALVRTAIPSRVEFTRFIVRWSPAQRMSRPRTKLQAIVALRWTGSPKISSADDSSHGN